jgi:predicted Fe-Mo cluster-binding NifX family protein
MPKFTSDNAATHGRHGGQRSHQHLEANFADLVISDPHCTERVAALIQQGFRLVIALKVVQVSPQLGVFQEGPLE